MPETVAVECSGPGCTDTQQMGKRWADARRFCSDECKEQHKTLNLGFKLCSTCKTPTPVDELEDDVRGEPACPDCRGCGEQHPEDPA